jgi:DNA polymerase
MRVRDQRPPHNVPAMIEPTFIDFENRSKCSLKKAGGRAYAVHPSTELVCAVLRKGDRYEVIAGGRGTPPPPKLYTGGLLVAHNAVGFDRHIWTALGWPGPDEWGDSSEYARLAGYPKASIEWLGENLVGLPKDKAGSALTKSLSRVNKKTGEFAVALTAPVLERVVAYCKIDVDVMADSWAEALHIFYQADIPGLARVDRAIIDRGMCFDLDLAQHLIECDAALVGGVLEAAGVTAKQVRSVPQLRARLAELGAPVPDCKAPTIEALLDHEDPEVATLAAARLGVSTIAAGKLKAGLALVSPDGRLRDTLRYYAAHTGRWGGKGMQLQNLPGGPKDKKDPVYAAIRSEPELFRLLAGTLVAKLSA